MASSTSLADFLRSSQIDNFTVDGDRVRIGGRVWHASRCACGEAGCDGWQMTPAEMLVHGEGMEKSGGA